MTNLLAIPCYNCEKQILRVIESLKNQSLENIDEIIFINNKSTDRTADNILSHLSSGLNVSTSLLNNTENYGLGGSFKIVYNYALEKNFENFIFFHGDDQAKVEDLSPMISEMLLNNELSALLGSRFHRESNRQGYSFIRTLGNKVLNLVFSIICFRRISEIGSGLNIYRTSRLKSFQIDQWPNHIAFDVNIILTLIRRGLKFKFYPINWTEKDQVSNAGNISTALLVLSMLFKWRFGVENHSLQWKRDFKYDKIDL